MLEKPKTVAKKPPLNQAPRVDLPPIHVEFRMNQSGGKYFPSMAGHKVMTADFHLTPEHVKFLNTEQIRVDFERDRILLNAASSGAICHRLDNNVIRSSVIFETVDETLLYCLFGLTNGQPIFIDGISKYIEDFDVSMNVAPSTHAGHPAIMLLTNSKAVLNKSVPVSAENSRKVYKRREQLRSTPFADRMAMAEKLIGELSLVMETFENVPGIDTRLVVARDGKSVKARLRRI